MLSTAVMGAGGGGLVSQHECNALSKFCDSVDVFDITKVPNENRSDPFQVDWHYSNLVDKPYDIVHLNGKPFTRTLMSLKYYNPDIKIVSSVPVHNIEVSREEHIKSGIDYDSLYPHMVVPELLRKYIHQDMIADLIIYPSRMAKAYYDDKFKPQGRNVVIPHGCTPCKKPSYPSNPSSVRFGYIGVMGADKGIQYLIDGWNRSWKGNGQLTFFGRDSEQVKQPFSIFKQIDVYGGYSDLDEIMPKFDVYVCSSATEGFNLGALESAGYGKAIIVSDGAGASELFVDKRSALVTKSRDTVSTCQAMQYFVDNPSEVSKFGRRAYDVAKDYDWNRIEDEYVKAYTELMK